MKLFKILYQDHDGNFHEVIVRAGLLSSALYKLLDAEEGLKDKLDYVSITQLTGKYID